MLKGIFPALPTPFNQDGTLDLSRIPPMIEKLFAEGIDGFFVCGTTGEGISLTAEEKILVIRETLGAVNRRANIIAQVACCNYSDTLRVAQEAITLGVDALSILQPWFYHLDDEAQFNYIKSIANAIRGFPLYLYNIPGHSGNNLSEGTIARLIDSCGNIRGIKESGSLDALTNWFEYQSERFQVICGMDNLVCESLRMGGKAIVAATANVQPRIFKRLYDTVMAGLWDEADNAQAQIDRYLPIIDNPNLIATVKESLKLKGFDTGYVRFPLRNLEPHEIEHIKQQLLDGGILKADHAE